MRVPSVSVAGMLFGIALLAIDMAAVEVLSRGMSPRSWEFGVLFGSLPLLNALAIGLYAIGRRLAAWGEAGPFLVGFQVAGWMSLALFLIAKFGFDNTRMDEYASWAVDGLETFWHQWVMWTGSFTYEYTEVIRAGFRILVVASPPILATLLGAWCVARLGLTVVRGDAAGVGRRAIPARRAAGALLVAILVLSVAIGAARIRGRWLIYRRLADSAVMGQEVHWRQYEETLAKIRELDRDPGDLAKEPRRLVEWRMDLVKSADSERRGLETDIFERNRYEPAARRPWLPIPPNPPLSPYAVEGWR